MTGPWRWTSCPCRTSINSPRCGRCGCCWRVCCRRGDTSRRNDLTMASVYLETTIPSYLTAWRSPELVMAARQEITRDWWDIRRGQFDLFISQLVLDEASAGDADAVSRRLAILQDIPLIEPQAGTDELVEA